MKNLWKNHLVRQTVYYLFYNFLVALSCLIIVSLVVFFHFLLDHRLGVIEEWVFDRGWQIVIISKGMALMVVLSFVNLHSQSRHPIKEFWSAALITNPPKTIFVVIVLLLTIVVLLAHPKLDVYPDTSIYKVGVSFLGSILFYLLDIFLLSNLQLNYPLNPRLSWLRVFLFSAIFLFSARGTFLFGLGLDIVVFCHMFFCLYLSEQMKVNWSLPTIYLLLFVAPTGAFFGMDAIWGDVHSIFQMTGKVDWIEMVVLCTVSLLYLSYRQKTG